MLFFLRSKFLLILNVYLVVVLIWFGSIMIGLILWGWLSKMVDNYLYVFLVCCIKGVMFYCYNLLEMLL